MKKSLMILIKCLVPVLVLILIIISTGSLRTQQFSLLTPPLGGWGAWLQ